MKICNLFPAPTLRIALLFPVFFNERNMESWSDF